MSSGLAQSGGSGTGTLSYAPLNGQSVADPQHRLEGRGDTFDIAHLKRVNGTFCDSQIGLACP